MTELIRLCFTILPSNNELFVQYTTSIQLLRMFPNASASNKTSTGTYKP